VSSAAFSPDGQRVVTASLDKTVRIWDASTGRQTLLLSGHTDRVWCAAFSPDGRRIVTTSNDRTGRLWDAATGHEIAVLSGHTDRVWNGAFSADSGRVVTASEDKTARIWDATTGLELMVLSGHSDMVTTARFSPDGRRVVTASNDKTARIWDAVTGQELAVLNGHTDIVEAAEFSPDASRIVTASDDGTARFWSARAPALDIQIGWAEAAQFDPLPGALRFQLGLPTPIDVHQWPGDPSKCDQSAAAPYDPDRRAPGVMLERIAPDVAVPACAGEGNTARDAGRSLYQHGRALMASGDFSAARRDFEAALTHGYRAAGVDLPRLLSQPSMGMLDLPQAISLYERAWEAGITIAAFELGNLYESGVHPAGDPGKYALAPDSARAWLMYRKGAESGEPTALARLAQQEDAAAFAEANPTKRNAQWLASFKYFAAAAERARREDWPYETWKNWRYRQASLARLLAREGMMQEVADEYESARRQYAAPPPTLWKRLASRVGMASE